MRWYDRKVWRKWPVTRSIYGWVVPSLGSVQMGVCRCGLKTVTPFVQAFGHVHAPSILAAIARGAE
jgi:hypothetical protein